MPLRRVVVYCGSSPGSHGEYVDTAQALGRTLAERDIELVYGGAKVGTMGAIADAALEAGGRVIGVIPSTLVEMEVAHEGLTEFHEVATMHERKALMLELSDGAITLPGGHGSLDELFEALAWLQLGIHSIPIGLLNVRGYYDHLLAHLNHARSEGFLAPDHHDLLLVEEDADRLLDQMARFRT
jgi:uncharacterized protein (TIGR00730 family)